MESIELSLQEIPLLGELFPLILQGGNLLLCRCFAKLLDCLRNERSVTAGAMIRQWNISLGQRYLCLLLVGLELRAGQGADNDDGGDGDGQDSAGELLLRGHSRRHDWGKAGG
jgi:hypothetical protein